MKTAIRGEVEPSVRDGDGDTVVLMFEGEGTEIYVTLTRKMAGRLQNELYHWLEVDY